MNYATSFVSSGKSRHIILLFLVEIAILFAMGFGQLSNGNQAFAKPLTAEPKFYQAQATTEQPSREAEAAKEQGNEANQNVIEQAQEKIESAAKNVREKLNLDESTPESTEKFKRQMKGEEPVPNPSDPPAPKRN